MRPTAGHKLCQALSTNLHPSVFPTKSRRAVSRTVVLVLAPGCQKCCCQQSRGCGNVSLEIADVMVSAGHRNSDSEASPWSRVAGTPFLLVERVTLHPACLNQEPNLPLCFTISLPFAARNQPVQRL